MNLLCTITVITMTGGLSTLADDPPQISKAEVGMIDWWLQWSHPGSLPDIPEARGWTHLIHKDFKIAVLIGMDQTDGTSHIPVSAYIYNEAFKEWRSFMTLNTRHAFHLRAAINEKSATLEIIGAKYSPLEGKLIASYSLEAVSNDRAFVNEKRKTEQGVADQRPAAVKSKPE